MSFDPADYTLLAALGIPVLAVGLFLALVLLRQVLSSQEASPTSTPVSVLVVDSAPQTRANIVKFLRLTPAVFIVGEAATGQAAITQAEQLHPSVVLLDLTLPDLDGLTVAKAIANEMPTTRFVLTREATTREPADWPPGLAAPLVKPLNYHNLIRAIHQARRFV